MINFDKFSFSLWILLFPLPPNLPQIQLTKGTRHAEVRAAGLVVKICWK